MHQVEPFVDIAQIQLVRDHGIDFYFSVHVPIHDLRHVGPPPSASESRSLPNSASHQLERASRNLGSRRRDSDDDRLAPTAMAAFERSPHNLDIARAVEGIFRTADRIRSRACQVDEIRHQIAFDFFRIHEMRHAEPLAPFFLFRIYVDADDHVGSRELQPLDHVQPDSAKPEHDCPCARLNLRGVQDGTYAGRHTAADIANLVERSVLPHLCHRDFRQDRMGGKG